MSSQPRPASTAAGVWRAGLFGAAAAAATAGSNSATQVYPAAAAAAVAAAAKIYGVTNGGSAGEDSEEDWSREEASCGGAHGPRKEGTSGFHSTDRRSVAALMGREWDACGPFNWVEEPQKVQFITCVLLIFFPSY